ncbi:MAG: hypothetical protein AB3N20_02995 [Rhizobiaceae bacterium]
MSDDPETARQIAELAKDTRPLLVLDVDEVVLEFVGPFMAFLNDAGYELKVDSFRLHGNVVSANTGEVTERETVSALLNGFFEAQESWQTAATGAAETVEDLAEDAEIVMLTAMPHQFRDARRRLLDRTGFRYPLLTTQTAKGPAIEQLRGKTPRPVTFIDDIPHNLISVQRSVPDAGLIHLMAHEGMRALLPPMDMTIDVANSWIHAGDLIRKHLSL